MTVVTCDLCGSTKNVVFECTVPVRRRPNVHYVCNGILISDIETEKVDLCLECAKKVADMFVVLNNKGI